MTTTLEDNFNGFLRELTPFVKEIRDGYEYDPGSSDLDDEQPIHVRMTMGNYRKAMRLLHALDNLNFDGVRRTLISE